MIIAQIIKLAAAKLIINKFNNPYFEIEILLSHILKKPREFILTHPEYKLNKKQISDFNFLIFKKLKNQPIAYLIKQKEFFDLKFFVNKDVLIPRPETELIVEETLKLATNSAQSITFIDIGTGSGCIVITLAKLLNQKSKIKNQNLIGIDISKKALCIARKNAQMHNVSKNIKFFHGNLLKPIIQNIKHEIQNTKYIITANLPYLTLTQIKNSPSIKYEPKKALNGGKNGLKLYEKLFKQINNLIKNTKYKIQNTFFILCEIDPSQTIQIKQLVKKYLPKSKLQIKKDLAGLNRLAIINKN
ncbi:MAG: peptide chain release factor N(5)-glutamine methyltransferase [Patescibacteria group bacterium]|nr:peptide chain release factor N(5)-glutamine methyltransferase [Patescibacteria group bacterium]MBU1871038.1 peptide chain release factor N(5)-glutamine methyltransferase [Patescibacteria group bacterium]